MNLFGSRRISRRKATKPAATELESDAVDAAPIVLSPNKNYPEAPPAEVVEAYRQWWRDAANNGARFRVESDEPFRGYQFGEPFLHVRLVEDENAEAETFDAIADYLYFRGVGGILCRDGWNAEQIHNVDCLWLGYGWMVDYRLNGVLVARTPSSQGWGTPTDKYRIRYQVPDFDVLLPFQRYVMEKALQQAGLKEPKIVLVVDHLGNRSLTVNIHAYFPPGETAMFMSGFINSFLPRYYSQTVFDNDYDAAVFPLQPFTDGTEEEQLEEIYYAEAAEKQRREAARFEAALDAEATPSAGEQRWREKALDSRTCFQVSRDDVIRPGQGAYLVLRLCRPGQTGYAFHQAALFAADESCGVLLCQSNWSPEARMSEEEAQAAYLLLSLGDVVDFLMTGKLDRRRLLSEGWLRSMEYYTGRFSEPDVRLLPMQSREAIFSILQQAGVPEPKVALQTLKEGYRLLHFSGFEVVGYNEEQHASLVNDIRWCLPRHYSVFLLNSEEYLHWSVLPNEATPSEEFFDLDDDTEEEETEE